MTTTALNYAAGVPGLDISVEVYPLIGGDVVPLDIPHLPENTHRPGYYAGNTTATGICWLRVLNGDSPLESMWGNLQGGNCVLVKDLALLNISDPLAALVPGSYGAGTAGSVLGNLVGTIISSISQSITIPSPSPVRGGTLELIVGDDYFLGDGNAKQFTLTGYTADWTDATIELILEINGVDTVIQGVIDDETGSERDVHFDIANAVTSLLEVTNDSRYDVVVVLPTSLRRQTVIEDGLLIVRK